MEIHSPDFLSISSIPKSLLSSSPLDRLAGQQPSISDVVGSNPTLMRVFLCPWLGWAGLGTTSADIQLDVSINYHCTVLNP